MAASYLYVVVATFPSPLKSVASCGLFCGIAPAVARSALSVYSASRAAFPISCRSSLSFWNVSPGHIKGNHINRRSMRSVCTILRHLVSRQGIWLTWAPARGSMQATIRGSRQSCVNRRQPGYRSAARRIRSGKSIRHSHCRSLLERARAGARLLCAAALDVGVPEWTHPASGVLRAVCCSIGLYSV